MMLRYSYKTELQRLVTNKMAIEMALISSPEDEKLKTKLQEKNKEIAWFEQQIKENKDPGTLIL